VFTFSSYDNPLIPLSELKAITEGLEEATYKQEILAEFVDWEGSAFPEKYLEKCIRGELESPISGHQYFMGVDLAKVMEALRQITLRKNVDYVSPLSIPKEVLSQVPQIALVSCLRKFSA
jgi:hypothetical protein